MASTALVTIEPLAYSRVPLESVPAITKAFQELKAAMSGAGLEVRGDGLRLSEIGDRHDGEDT